MRFLPIFLFFLSIVAYVSLPIYATDSSATTPTTPTTTTPDSTTSTSDAACPTASQLTPDIPPIPTHVTDGAALNGVGVDIGTQQHISASEQTDKNTAAESTDTNTSLGPSFDEIEGDLVELTEFDLVDMSSGAVTLDELIQKKVGLLSTAQAMNAATAEKQQTTTTTTTASAHKATAKKKALEPYRSTSELLSAFSFNVTQAFNQIIADKLLKQQQQQQQAASSASSAPLFGEHSRCELHLGSALSSSLDVAVLSSTLASGYVAQGILNAGIPLVELYEEFVECIKPQAYQTFTYALTQATTAHTTTHTDAAAAAAATAAATQVTAEVEAFEQCLSAYQSSGQAEEDEDEEEDSGLSSQRHCLSCSKKVFQQTPTKLVLAQTYCTDLLTDPILMALTELDQPSHFIPFTTLRQEKRNEEKFAADYQIAKLIHDRYFNDTTTDAATIEQEIKKLEAAAAAAAASSSRRAGAEENEDDDDEDEDAEDEAMATASWMHAYREGDVRIPKVPLSLSSVIAKLHAHVSQVKQASVSSAAAAAGSSAAGSSAASGEHYLILDDVRLNFTIPAFRQSIENVLIAIYEEKIKIKQQEVAEAAAEAAAKNATTATPNDEGSAQVKETVDTATTTPPPPSSTTAASASKSTKSTSGPSGGELLAEFDSNKPRETYRSPFAPLHPDWLWLRAVQPQTQPAADTKTTGDAQTQTQTQTQTSGVSKQSALPSLHMKHYNLHRLMVDREVDVDVNLDPTKTTTHNDSSQTAAAATGEKRQANETGAGLSMDSPRVQPFHVDSGREYQLNDRLSENEIRLEWTIDHLIYHTVKPHPFLSLELLRKAYAATDTGSDTATPLSSFWDTHPTCRKDRFFSTTTPVTFNRTTTNTTTTGSASASAPASVGLLDELLSGLLLGSGVTLRLYSTGFYDAYAQSLVRQAVQDGVLRIWPFYQAAQISPQTIYTAVMFDERTTNMALLFTTSTTEINKYRQAKKQWLLKKQQNAETTSSATQAGADADADADADAASSSSSSSTVDPFTRFDSPLFASSAFPLEKYTPAFAPMVLARYFSRQHLETPVQVQVQAQAPTPKEDL